MRVCTRADGKEKLLGIEQIGSLKFSHDFLFGVASDVASTVVLLQRKSHKNIITYRSIYINSVHHAFWCRR